MTKRYDRAYFDKWYRNPRSRVNADAEVRRKVALALSTAEYFLRRNARNVLDIGCGEGAWRSHLRALRPTIAYAGIDPSEYVVEQFGKERNIRRGGFGELTSLNLARADLVVCSDVLHYVPESEIREGVAEIARLCNGLAFIEVLTSEDDIIGDLDGLIRRSSAWYRRTFAKAGLVEVGAYCWLSPKLRDSVAEMESH
ncbi:MAG TPA: class I SAM-dependent methyltransferase [Thermoanaerobaculia bacterium]|nr:class I SAM-dependent methyltransferase [Thermoanaerobaculia bacterium]